MKKVNLIFASFLCAFGYAQTTLGYYTEAAVTATVTAQALNSDFITVNNVYPDEGTDGGTTVIEAKALGTGTNYQAYFNYPGSPNQDLSTYSYYHVSLKSTSPQATIIRLEDAAGQQANFDPITFGFAYDGDWHSMTIPFTAIKAQNASFNFTDVNNVFFVKSIPGEAGFVVPESYVFYIDNVYFSTSDALLSAPDYETSGINLYPNPATNQISLRINGEVGLVTICTAAGQKVLTTNTVKNLNISALESGLYFVNAFVNGTNITTNFLKK